LISGMPACPAGRWGNGRLSGRRRCVCDAGRAQAGRPPAPIAATPAPAALSSVRRVSPGAVIACGTLYRSAVTCTAVSSPNRRSGWLLTATRWGLPLAIAVVGIALVVAGGASAGSVLAATGVSLIIAALIVWMINWMYRMSVQSNREREREEAAREYFTLHGRWPEE